MRTKFHLISMLGMMAVVLAACAPAATGSQPSIRTLNVNGNAQVYLTPDIAYINIGVHTEYANAAEAVAANNSLAQAVAAAVKAMGVEDKDIRTSNFSIYPQQNYGPNGERLDILFVVDNTVYVTMRDLTVVGELLQAAVEAGANSINSITFDVEDKTAALAEARQAAIANARSQAEELAQAAGVTLGEIQSINFYNNYPTPVYDVKGVGGAAMAAAEVPISAGQLVVTVDVSLVYEIR